MKYIILLLILFLGYIFLSNKIELFDTFKSTCSFENDYFIIEKCINKSSYNFNNFMDCLNKNNTSRKVYESINHLNFIFLKNNPTCDNIKNTIDSIYIR